MYSIFKKFLFSLDPETAHLWVKNLGCAAPKFLIRQTTKVCDPVLKASIGNQVLDNPIGLAAGFDKNGEMIDFMTALGFGYLELGSVTLNPCAGNPKPRIFRLPADDSLINRMGLPNAGMDSFLKNVRRKKWKIPLGVNIAKTPFFSDAGGQAVQKHKGIDEYIQIYSKLASVGAYHVFNLSCPNTTDGKTFEDAEVFGDLARAVLEVRRDLSDSKPLLIKISPDLEKKELHKLVDEALKHGFDGFVVSNSTARRPKMKTKSDTVKKIGSGGLTGKVLAEMADHQLKNISEIVGRDKILVGVGGIMSFADLVRKLSLGASLFQVYTGLIYQGPYFVKTLNSQLVQFCRRHKVANYQELIGVHGLVSSL